MVHLTWDSGLLLGAAAVALGAFLGGITGFGYGLIATPLLLLLGYPLAPVVVANVLLGCSSRVITALTLRREMDLARVGTMLAGNAPGLLAGLAVLSLVPAGLLRRGIGATVVVCAVLLVVVRRVAVPQRRRTVVAAGFAGGVLGVTSSLNGIPPAILYAVEGAPARRMVADLSGYFVVSNLGIAAVMAASGQVALSGLAPAVALWLPGVLLMTTVSNRLAGRLRPEVFRWLVLALIFAGGVSVLVG